MTRDAGSASVYVLAGALLVVGAALVPVVTGEAAVARHRAAVAADAAALAGAITLDTLDPGGVRPAVVAGACARAAAVAAANGARIGSCIPVGCPAPAPGSLQVTARVGVRVVGIGVEARVEAVARAGPAGCLPNRPRPGPARRSLEPSGAPSRAPGR